MNRWSGLLGEAGVPGDLAGTLTADMGVVSACVVVRLGPDAPALRRSTS